MTTLTIFNNSDPVRELSRTTNHSEISARLNKHGIRLERWEASVPLQPGADSEDVLQAYAADVSRLNEEGYTTVDVVRLVPDASDPEWETKAKGARAKFLNEHTHADDEVRFFVEGSGAFYLRMDQEVLAVICEAGDLISVPAGVTHWFDMGTSPSFTAIRLFKTPEGWVGDFTGSEISSKYPTYDDLVAA